MTPGDLLAQQLAEELRWARVEQENLRAGLRLAKKKEAEDAAALTHLATRAAEAEGRAERAEARIVKLRATLDAAAQASGANAVIDLCDNALCVDILDADQPDADAAVPRG